MKAISYIQFDGRAEEALTFYNNSLQASNMKFVRFSAFDQESNMSLTAEEQNMIMESYIEFSGNILMISDVPHFMESVVGDIKTGNSVLISIIDADLETNKQIFERLSEGGTVIMPLSKTPWSSSFGILIDKFDVMWKFNSDASKFIDSFES